MSQHAGMQVVQRGPIVPCTCPPAPPAPPAPDDPPAPPRPAVPVDCARQVSSAVRWVAHALSVVARSSPLAPQRNREGRWPSMQSSQMFHSAAHGPLSMICRLRDAQSASAGRPGQFRRAR